MWRDYVSERAREIATERRRFLGASAYAAAGSLLLLDRLDCFAQAKKDVDKMNSPLGRPLTSAQIMAAAASAFLNSLTQDQRGRTVFRFGDEQRYDWHFIPRARKGIPLKELAPEQSHLANALLAAGLGQRGFIKATSIMSLESVLRELEAGRGPVRDPQLYYFTLFGDPLSSAPWGWRVEGHHVSLNYTLIDDQIATTPHFLGSNPAEVLQGPRQGLRVQPREQDLARAFVKSLDDKQRALAVVAESAPRDIISGNSRRAEAVKPPGLPAGKLSQKQADLLMELLREYAAAMPDDIATARLERIRGAGFANVHFAWAGGLEKRQAHYYRIQGPSFLVEYDNIQNDANHIHTVWRDFNGDFGEDLLALHYKKAHI